MEFKTYSSFQWLHIQPLSSRIPCNLQIQSLYIDFYRLVAQSMILNKHLLEKKGDPEEYDVERIVAERKDGNRMLYLVKWVGYPHEENTWQPRAHLKNAPEKIREWNRIKKRKNNRLSASQVLEREPQETYIKNTKKQCKNQSKPIKKPKATPNKSMSQNNPKDFLHDASETKREAQLKKEQKDMTTLNKCQGVTLRSRKNLSARQLTHKEIELSRSTESENYSKIQKSINMSPMKEEAPFFRKYRTGMQTNLKQTHQEHSDCLLKKQSLKHEYDDVFIVQQSISQSQLLQKHQSYRRYEDNLQIFFEMDQDQKKSFQQQDLYLKKEVPEEEGKRLHQNCSNLMEFNLYEKNERFVIQCEEEENAGQSVEPVSCLPQLRSSHNHFFEESPQQGPVIFNEPEYSMLAEITKLFKEQGIVYCSVLTKIGQQIDKLPYEAIEAERPDLVCSFFNGKYTCNLSLS